MKTEDQVVVCVASSMIFCSSFVILPVALQYAQGCMFIVLTVFHYMQ
jgi:hypothetical protein